jgi:hypothetical protein
VQSERVGFGCFRNVNEATLRKWAFNDFHYGDLIFVPFLINREPFHAKQEKIK